MNTQDALGEFRPPWNMRNPLQRIGAHSYLIAPIVAVVVALWDASLNGMPWVFVLMAVMRHIVTGFGITAGYHRGATHQSFKLHDVPRFFLYVFGAMAGQGPLWWWGDGHRTHHLYSDQRGKDPHTPYEFGDAVTVRGFWYAHFGWLLYDRPVAENSVWRRLRNVDGRGDRVARYVDDHYVVWVILGFVIPTLIGLAYTGTMRGAFLGLIWGGGVGFCTMQHATWLVNSACHTIGKRPFKTDDRSRNNALSRWVSLGEGDHNAHHAYESSACHNLDHSARDATYQLIRLFEWLGWAYDVIHPRPAIVATLRA